eukprot:7179446-Alexandrium_andersonii.AAC.1
MPTQPPLPPKHPTTRRHMFEPPVRLVLNHMRCMKVHRLGIAHLVVESLSGARRMPAGLRMLRPSVPASLLCEAC